MVKYLIGIFVLIFLSSTTSFFSFAQTANTKRESRNDRKEKKVDEIYRQETSFINTLSFAEDFQQRYEKYLKESIRKQLKIKWADALSAFGEGINGRTANPENFASTRLESERKKIYQDWINEVSSRNEQYTEQHLSNSKTKNFGTYPTLYIYGGDNHDVFLGCLNCDDNNSNSIWNEYGTFGNGYNSDCIWNEYGTFGNEYGLYSPWNEYATNPPVIVDKDGNSFGYFTTNRSNDKRADFELVLIVYKYYDLIRGNVTKWHDKIFEE